MRKLLLNSALSVVGAAVSIGVLVAAGLAGAQETQPGGQAEVSTTAPDAAPAGAADWPCDQPQRPEISVGSVWQGPDPEAVADSWHDVPAVTALVDLIAPRRMPQDEAVASVHRFAAGYADAKERTTVLTQVFAGLFDTLDKERGQIIRGIRHFNKRQDSLSHRIEEGWKQVDALDPNSTDPAVQQQRVNLQEAIDWDSRIFDDRQHLLPQICQQPSVIEQRLFALSRALQQDIGAGAGQ